MMNKTFVQVICFLFIASVFSFTASKLPPIELASINGVDILCGLGPFVSALICYRFFKVSSEYSLAGSQTVKVIVITALSVVTFIITTAKNTFAANLLVACSQIIYCFGEEYGWRHYLQTITNGLNKWLQALVIGTIWLCWHYSWLQEPLKAMLGQNFEASLPLGIGIGIVALSSFSLFLGWFMQKTNALLLPVLVHFALKTNSQTLLVVILLTVVATITWDKLRFAKDQTSK